jgi:hypothetical protein
VLVQRPCIHTLEEGSVLLLKFFKEDKGGLGKLLRELVVIGCEKCREREEFLASYAIKISRFHIAIIQQIV